MGLNKLLRMLMWMHINVIGIIVLIAVYYLFNAGLGFSLLIAWLGGLVGLPIMGRMFRRLEKEGQE